MMFVSIVGHASFQTAGASGPSTIERSYFRRCCVVLGAGTGAGSVAVVGGAAGAAVGVEAVVTSSIYRTRENSTGEGFRQGSPGCTEDVSTAKGPCPSN